MAGQYYYDPRPFYSPPGEYKLVSLDDLFNPGKKEPKLPEEKKDEKKGGDDGGKKKDSEKKEEEKSKVIELKVNLCCDNCAWKVKQLVEDMEGVEKVDCCQWTKKVTVKGTVKPEHVLKRVQKVKKDAEMWPKKKNN